MKTAVVGSVTLGLALAGPAVSASHPFTCDRAQITPIPAVAPVIYVVRYDGLTFEHDAVREHYVYLESNGTAGLQPGGPSPVFGESHADPCPTSDPDLRLY
jgi:hypothetical protein